MLVHAISLQVVIFARFYTERAKLVFFQHSLGADGGQARGVYTF